MKLNSNGGYFYKDLQPLQEDLGEKVSPHLALRSLIYSSCRIYLYHTYVCVRTCSFHIWNLQISIMLLLARCTLCIELLLNKLLYADATLKADGFYIIHNSWLSRVLKLHHCLCRIKGLGSNCGRILILGDKRSNMIWYRVNNGLFF